MLAADIARRAEAVSPGTFGGAVVARFEREGDIHILPVVADGRPVGLITRERLLQHFSHRYGRELWDRRPISQLMNASPRIIPADTPVESICKMMASISPEALLEGVVFIDADGRYAGVASAFDLYQASVYVTESKNRDLTDLAARLGEETQKATQASRAKSDFLATMSHEIRTPLNGILGMAQALAQETLADGQREKVDLIVSSGETLTHLLNDVLDLSKIEAGRLDITPVDSELGRTFDRVRKLFEPIAAEKGVKLVMVREDAGDDWLNYDPVRVHQCLANLISNAVKFTGQGEVEVRYSIAPPDREGARRVRARIRDTGIGMDAETLGRLFNAFTQADGSITRRFGGTGLGLAITRKLARLMEGDVTVESTPGFGSTFTLEFEAASAAARKPSRTQAADAEGEAQPAQPSRALRILLVDDNAINRQVVRLFLAGMRTEVIEAENGIEALERLAARAFDLVLLDIHMPVMDGCETIQRIRANDLWSALPVIALTADAMEGDRERFVAMGMTDYVAKPIDRRLLLGKIAAVASHGRRAEPAPVQEAEPAQDIDLSDILGAIDGAAA